MITIKATPAPDDISGFQRTYVEITTKEHRHEAHIIAQEGPDGEQLWDCSEQWLGELDDVAHSLAIVDELAELSKSSRPRTLAVERYKVEAVRCSNGVTEDCSSEQTLGEWYNEVFDDSADAQGVADGLDDDREEYGINPDVEYRVTTL